MNLPNIPYVAPARLTVLLVVSLSVEYRLGALASRSSSSCRLLASLTDYLDGVLARKWNLITDFGKLMDPLADKILTASAFICLIPFGALPAWAVIIIISREFVLDLPVTPQFKGSDSSSRLGKHKTAWQMITIVFFLRCSHRTILLPGI